jgi:hypothetical protein
MQQATLIGLEIGRLRGLPSLDPFAGNGPDNSAQPQIWQLWPGGIAPCRLVRRAPGRAEQRLGEGGLHRTTGTAPEAMTSARI